MRIDTKVQLDIVNEPVNKVQLVDIKTIKDMVDEYKKAQPKNHLLTDEKAPLLPH